MEYPILRQQLPQKDTKRIDVHSWCDRVLLGLLHGVLVLANGAQQLWSGIARVADLQCAEEFEGESLQILGLQKRPQDQGAFM